MRLPTCRMAQRGEMDGSRVDEPLEVTMRLNLTHIFLALGGVIFLTAPAHARTVRIVIERRESPAYKGQPFKDAGPYERLTGHAYGELDPKDPLNAVITDIQLAPRNARGMVEYAATFTMAKP